MLRLTSWTFLIILSLSAYKIQDAHACSCTMPSHPQTSFCRAEWVAALKIKGLNTNRSRDEPIVYDIEIIEIFKAPPGAEEALRQHLNVWTSGEPAACQVWLHPGKSWVVSGRMSGSQPWLAECQPNEIWTAESAEEQRIRFGFHYGLGCDCTISLGYRIDEPKPRVFFGNSSDPNAPVVEYEEPAPLITEYSKACDRIANRECEDKYGACIKHGLSGCSWFPSPAYNECINENA